MVDYAKAIWEGSPNYWTGRAGFEPLYVVAHGTAGASPGCINWLCSTQSGASVHYVVDTDGLVYQLVPEDSASWGNGIPEPPSDFMGKMNPNFYTIAVETVRTGENTSPVTPAQQAAWTELLADIRRRHGPLPLIPHSAISPQSRAHCPGPGFPMDAIDQGASPPPPPAGVVRLSVPFSGTPQRVPLVFYRDWSFKRPAYTSAANRTTTLHFDQWTYGPAVVDPSTGQPDAQWWHRANPGGQCGWVPSAWVIGHPPGNPSVTTP